MHLKIPERVFFTVHWGEMGITKCCTFFPFDVTEKVHLLQMHQPLAWEHIKVLVWYNEVHWGKCDQ